MYTHAVCGGTFDHFHSGHVALLTEAFHIATHVTIGLTTDKYVSHYKYDEENISGVACASCSSTIQSYGKRKQHLEAWLQTQGFAGRVTIVPIDDAYGPTVKKNTASQAMDVLVASDDTNGGAIMINEKRKAVGLSVLPIHTIHMLLAEDTKPISATRIRNQEIDEKGTLVMPHAMRGELAEPFGTVLKDGNTESIIRGDHEAIIISVGDKTTKRLVENGLVPTLVIIDMQVERQPYVWEKELWDKLPKKQQEFVSGPGYISASVVDALAIWAKKPTPVKFVIDGEEDLLVLPVICQAPTDAVVYYGQPGVGMVRVVVTEATKKRAAAFLRQFTS
ncbi:MAG: pantetheine-phosphate adenylyltransferase [Microgenomates group bacterium]